jgi:hypothetical protein
MAPYLVRRTEIWKKYGGKYGGLALEIMGLNVVSPWHTPSCSITTFALLFVVEEHLFPPAPKNQCPPLAISVYPMHTVLWLKHAILFSSIVMKCVH